MKALLAIAHYFRAEEGSRNSSTYAEAAEERGAAVRKVIEAWRGHFCKSSVLNLSKVQFEPGPSFEDDLDIAVLVHEENHLLDGDFCAKHNVRRIGVAAENPRMLPFAAHQFFADNRHAYDMFVYSEDDLRPSDPTLLSKVAAFGETFGWRRLVMPNRYEWNLAGPSIKTYIDGDIAFRLVEPHMNALPDEQVLRQGMPYRDILYHRACNPHSGFFAINAVQLSHWMRQPHFSDLDCSFVSPLESAATLGLLKTFPIYKSFARDMGWLEIEHLDARWSNLDQRRVGRRVPG
jgi:hypothetical protein